MSIGGCLKPRKINYLHCLDCYMAVTGLPEPQADHAVAMCKFACECLSGMHVLLAGLETTLGPGTFAIVEIRLHDQLASCLLRAPQGLLICPCDLGFILVQ
jgi:hypothetical protein